MSAPLFLVVAGDPSGDLHASNLIAALKRREPGARVAAVGGPLSRAVADEFIEDLASRGVTGFWEPALKIPFLLRLRSRLQGYLREDKPNALICVDYYGFNRRVLPLARDAGVPAFYFVSPQVWASRPGRVQVLKRFVKKMLVIFPFEEKVYRDAGVPVEFVGHPLLDLIPEPKAKTLSKPPVIGLLPGSRSSELKRHIPVFYEAFRILRERHPDLEGLLFASANQIDAAYGKLPDGVALVREQDYAKRATLDLAICSSGTATLENALLGVPMVVVYKLSWPTYAIARALVKVKHIAMANLLAGKTVVPELIQRDATAENAADEAARFLDDADYAARTRAELLVVRRSLGTPGAADRAAAAVLAAAGGERVSASKRFRRYFRPYLGRFGWACAAMLVVSAFNGLAILLVKPIIDRLFIAQDMNMLWLAVFGLPFLVVLKSIASYIQTYLMSWIGQKVTQQIREDLFRHLHALPLEFYSGRKGADVLSRVTGDLTMVQTALTTLPVYMIRDTLTVVFLIFALFKLDWRFAGLAVLGSPLSLAALWVLSLKMRESSRQAQIAVDRLHHRFQESVQGMLVIKAYNYEPGATEKFQEENLAFFQPMMRYLRATALMTPLMEVGASFVVAAIIFFGGREVIKGRMTPGAFFAFLGALAAAYAPIKNLARTNAELQRAWTGVERLFDVLAEKAEDPKSRKPDFPGLKNTIRLDQVGFRYPGARSWALRGLDLEIPKGSRTALVGPSGCGKSTLARLLLRLHDPAEGRLLLDGADAKGFDAASIRARAGLVTTEAALFNDTVFQNVALGRRVVTLSEVERACRLAGAAEFVEALPEGYQTMLGDWGYSLSAGQRQKLALARVLLKDPELVVLDEATAHLDGAAEKEVLAAMETVLAGRTVVTISHDLRSVVAADRIAVLSAGAVAELGTHAELMAAHGLYRRLFDLEDAARPATEAP